MPILCCDWVLPSVAIFKLRECLCFEITSCKSRTMEKKNSARVRRASEANVLQEQQTFLSHQLTDDDPLPMNRSFLLYDTITVSRNTAPAPNIGLSGSWYFVKCVPASKPTCKMHLGVRYGRLTLFRRTLS